METILLSAHPKGLKIAHLVDGALSKLAFEPTLHQKQARLDDILAVRVVAVRHDFVWVTAGLDHEAVIKTQHFHNVLPSEGTYLWAQVSRMPWPEMGHALLNEKGYRLTTQLTLAGKYWLHNPRARKEMQWVRRTAAAGLSDRDPRLVAEHDELFRTAIRLHNPPEKIHVFQRALIQWQRWIRDSDAPKLRVICETPALLEEARRWVAQATLSTDLELVQATQTQLPLFEHFGVEDHWADVLTPMVSLRGGGSLDIREMAAATLIDVNAGGERDDAIHMNLKTLKTLVQQIMWRNLSGNILVDFLRLPTNLEDKFQVRVEEAFKGTDVKVLGFCQLGLLQLQRQRLRPSLSMLLLKQCPTCGGDGSVDI
jgi:Ribonuclease G/E